MKKIMKWLEKNGIKFQLTENGYIVIVLKKDCVWVNGFGEEMYWDSKISIHKNTYNEYIVYQTTGYNLGNTLYHGGKADKVIEILRMGGR